MRSLPVLLYHSVADWDNPIAVPPALFEAHMASLRQWGWRGIGLDEALDILVNNRPVPARVCLITFDDGYLDNWVYAQPLLGAHGHRGIMFAVTAKIDAATAAATNQSPAPTLADLRAGLVGPDHLPALDRPFANDALGFRQRQDRFCTWQECRAMEASGVMAVEAHSHRHRSVFTGPHWRHVFRPGPRKRTFDRMEASVPWGLPHFASGPALAHRAFLPSEELLRLVTELVPQGLADAAAWLALEAHRQLLTQRIQALGVEGLGRLESQAEFRARCQTELELCVASLRRELGRPPVALAWPWGPYADTAREVARELGLRLFCCTTVGPNFPGGAGHVHRFVAKAKSPTWLRSRLLLYSHGPLASLYARWHR